MNTTRLKSLLSPAITAVVALGFGLVMGVWMSEPPTGAVMPKRKQAKAAGHQHGAPPPKATGAAAAAGSATADKPSEDKPAEEEVVWTCSMHPQIKLPEPGPCPICGMDLIPLKRRGGDAGAGLRVEMSEAARMAASIETTVVKREAVTVPVRMVGKIAYDETRVARITAWFGGRIERTYVDFTGTRVRKGDHLVSIYSPELLVAQAELIQATKDAAHAPAGPIGEASRALKRASRDKLRLWGLMDWQVRQIVRRGRPIERVTIYAPMGGIVVHKNAVDGAWVKTGTPLYTIVDLSHVWVELDAYESDLAWLRYDQAASFEVAAFPGERFEGRIAFVNPTMDARTRTVKVRVDVANPDLRLKPEMFVRAQADVSVGAGHGPARTELAGKFICPMHPSEVADKPGRCSICGMKLVTAESHWLVGPGLSDGERKAPLVIPASAPLFTGRRVVVFVEQIGAKEPTYLVREVQLGARAGDKYLVRKGLMAGERVVSRGAFRLDSSMQILGEPSVMNHDGGDDAAKEPEKSTPEQLAKAVVDHARHVQHALSTGKKREIASGTAALAKAAAALPGARGLDQAIVWLTASRDDVTAAKRAFDDVLRIARLSVAGASRLTATAIPTDKHFAKRLDLAVRHTLAISAALAADDAGGARSSAEKLVPVAKALVGGKRPVNPALLTGALAIAEKDATIEAQRAGFEHVNIALIPLTVLHADLVNPAYEQVWCPMALDGKGAPWLQPPGEVANPYFGAKMLGCGGKVGGKVGGNVTAPAPAGDAKPTAAPKGAHRGHDHGGQ